MQCPHCGSQEAYRATRGRFRCKTCRKDFTEKSGTLLRGAKMPIEKYEQMFEAFGKGERTAAVARKVGCDYKTAHRYRHLILDTICRNYNGNP